MSYEEAIQVINRQNALKNKWYGNQIVMQILKAKGKELDQIDFSHVRDHGFQEWYSE